MDATFWLMFISALVKRDRGAASVGAEDLMVLTAVSPAARELNIRGVHKNPGKGSNMNTIIRGLTLVWWNRSPFNK
jgi:hypothetical protein